MMLTLPEDLTQKLEALAQKTSHSAFFCLKEAVESYIEDREDYLAACAVKKRILSGQEKTYSMDEVKRLCERDDAD